MGLLRGAPRVIVRVAGGLGNQLFMYAAGRRLATVRDVPLELDTASGFRGDPYKRSLGLDDLSIRAGRAGAFASYAEPLTGRPRELAQLVRDRYGLGPASWVVDSPYAVDASILDLTVERTRYLRGYFQSERYFADVAADIRADLAYRRTPAERSVEVARAIDAAPAAVAIHARVLYALPQIDEASGLPAADELGPDPFPLADYYRRAVAHVVAHVDRPHFFVFADHPHLVADRLELPGDVTVVDHNGHDKAAEDLWLMSRCAHHITCESTFGWWGAWLGTHPDQVVVAPETGFPNPEMVPPRWTKLPRSRPGADAEPSLPPGPLAEPG